MSLSPYPSVNGEKQDGGFHGVEGEVFPCAGSYRSGVAIRILKVGAERLKYASTVQLATKLFIIYLNRVQRCT